MPGCDDGIARQMRHAGVAGIALDGDRDAPAGRHHRAVVDRDRAGGEARPVVEAEDPAHRKALEQAGRDHRARAAIAFLGGLEDEIDRAAPAGVGREQGGGPEQRGRVPVMAAGVHDALMARGIRQAGVLGDRQRVHVGAQADARLRGPARQRGDDAMAADARLEGNAELSELVLHEGGGDLFLQGQFRMRMQMPAPRRQLLVQLGCQGETSFEWWRLATP
jgi:hypothetical protein